LGTESFGNIFKIPELKRRILFTLALLAVYRIGAHIPVPGIDVSALADFFDQMRGTILKFFDMFSGGALSRLTIFALGIMPYISSSIILQLLTVAVPHLEKLKKEGERVFFLTLKPFCGDARSDDYYREYALSAAEHDAAIREAYTTDTQLEIFYDEPYLWSMAEKYGFQISQSDSGITIPELTGCAASHSLYIQTDGDVRPCMFSPSELSFGNVARESLGAVWERMQTSDVLTGWHDRERRHGACASCQLFESCRGCLARTFLLTGDCTASDPCCPLSRDA